MGKVLLAVYGVKITDRGHEQMVDKFGNNLDLLAVFSNYLEHIFKNRQFIKPVRKGDSHRHISCLKTSIKKEGARAIYGYLVIGKNGETLKVTEYDIQSGNQKSQFDVTSDKFLDRNAFFYLSVPKNSKRAYLILQLPAAKGVKESIFNSFRDYWNGQGLNRYTQHFNSLVNAKLFYTMMEKGIFKEMKFTRNGIPAKIDDLENYSGKIPIQKGRVKTVITSDDLSWLKPLGTAMFEHSRKKELAMGTDKTSVFEFDYEQFSEVSMTIEMNGKNKTFHVRNQSRTMPDIDITDQLPASWDISDLLKEAKELVESVTFKIKDGDLKG